MKMTTCIYVLLAAMLLCACEKDPRLDYRDVPRAYFFTKDMYDNIDSMTYSFAIRESSLAKDTVKIPVKLMGDIPTHDMEIKASALEDSSTAVAGTHYQVLPSFIKKGQLVDSLAIVVIKTPELENAEVRLMLQIVPSKDVQPGVVEDNTYLLKINNILTKPDNWDRLLFIFFGSYSKVKYRWIIDQTGLYEFEFMTEDGRFVDFQHYVYLKQVLREKMEAYVAAHGILYDENNNPVTFPN